MMTPGVNEQAYTIEIEPEMSLLWALRDVMQLTGKISQHLPRNLQPEADL